MQVIENMEKAVEAIRKTLLKDATIRKLLYNNNPSGLDGSTPSETDVNKLIQNNVLIDFHNEENKTNIFNVIAIYASYIVEEEGKYTITINTDVFVSKRYINLNEGKSRVMALLKRVTALLENKKFFFSSQLNFESAEIRVINEPEMVGYTVSWEAIDAKSNEF